MKDGKFLRHEACKSCTSSDGLALYEYEEGRVGGKCFSCGKFYYNIEQIEKKKEFRKVSQITKEEVNGYPYRQDNDRGIYLETNQRYGVRVSRNERTNEVDTVWYPYHINKKLCGYKGRTLPKDFDCPSAGSLKGADLFGQQLVNTTFKKIVITEGEEDCLTVAQVLWEHFGKRMWPNVVSLVNGAGIGKGFERTKKFLEQFEQIILCFDNDEAGREALTKISQILDTRKIYVLNLSEKDANDCLLAGKKQEIIEGFTVPKKYKPEGILSIEDIRNIILNPKHYESVPYPDDWVEFNRLTEGMRIGDFDVFTGASSNGKTQLFREIAYNLLQKSKEKIGCIFLEETAASTIFGLGSLKVEKILQVPSVRKTITKEEQDSIIESFDTGRLVVRGNDFRNMSADAILSSVLYMANTEGCKYIIIDHLHKIISGSNASKENLNQTMDMIISKLHMYASTLDVWIGLAAHLRKTDGDFDYGAMARMEDIKGSGAAYQIPDGVYFIQRNRHHSNEQMKNVSRLHVLKNRKVSRCGTADFLEYDTTTGRMKAIPQPQFSIIEKATRKPQQSYEDF